MENDGSTGDTVTAVTLNTLDSEFVVLSLNISGRFYFSFKFTLAANCC